MQQNIFRFFVLIFATSAMFYSDFSQAKYNDGKKRAKAIDIMKAANKNFPFKNIAHCEQVLQVKLKEGKGSTFTATKSENPMIKKVTLKLGTGGKASNQFLVVDFSEPIEMKPSKLEEVFETKAIKMGLRSISAGFFTHYKFKDRTLATSSPTMGLQTVRSFFLDTRTK